MMVEEEERKNLVKLEQFAQKAKMKLEMDDAYKMAHKTKRIDLVDANRASTKTNMGAKKPKYGLSLLEQARLAASVETKKRSEMLEPKRPKQLGVHVPRGRF